MVHASTPIPVPGYDLPPSSTHHQQDGDRVKGAEFLTPAQVRSGVTGGVGPPAAFYACRPYEIPVLREDKFAAEHFSTEICPIRGRRVCKRGGCDRTSGLIPIGSVVMSLSSPSRSAVCPVSLRWRTAELRSRVVCERDPGGWVPVSLFLSRRATVCGPALQRFLIVIGCEKGTC